MVVRLQGTSTHTHTYGTVKAVRELKRTKEGVSMYVCVGNRSSSRGEALTSRAAAEFRGSECCDASE